MSAISDDRPRCPRCGTKAEARIQDWCWCPKCDAPFFYWGKQNVKVDKVMTIC